MSHRRRGVLNRYPGRNESAAVRIRAYHSGGSDMSIKALGSCHGFFEHVSARTMKPPSTRAKALPIGSGWGFVGTDTTLVSCPSFSSIIVRSFSSRAAQSCTFDQFTVLVLSMVVILEMHGADSVKSVIDFPSLCPTSVRMVFRIGMPAWSVLLDPTSSGGLLSAKGAVAAALSAVCVSKEEFSPFDEIVGDADALLLLHPPSKSIASAIGIRTVLIDILCIGKY
ncbi:hypothetical protein C8J43_103562 [Sphingomonas sp. PP-CE-1G-424]|nr:hypothetical protein C8J43_103562 [Sphingomonas sp. PP-CE-1G-424]